MGIQQIFANFKRMSAEQNQSENWGTKSIRITALATAALVLVGFIQAWILCQTDETNRLTNRAFVYVSRPTWVGIVQGRNEVSWIVSPEWHNSGNTPARFLDVEANCPSSERPLADPWDRNALAHNGDAKPVLGPKQTTPGVVCRIPVQYAKDAQQGKRHIYFTASAQYRDIFGSQMRVTEYCIEMVGLSGNFDDPKSTISFLGIPCKQHNCADEECSR